MRKIDFGSFCAGGLVCTLVCILLYAFVLGGSTATNDTVDTASKSEDEDKQPSAGELVQYDTGIKDWELKTESGETVKYKTPEGYYSLSDQYLDSMAQYYGVDKISDSSIIVIGDNMDSASAATVLNADTISDVKNMLKGVYGDEYSEEEMHMSEAYTYMTTGKLSEDADDSYKVEELKSFKVGDIEYKIYKCSYDLEMQASTPETDEEGNTTEPETTTTHYDEVYCYSNTEDPIEIVVYQAEYDEKTAVELIENFVGVEK